MMLSVFYQMSFLFDCSSADIAVGQQVRPVIVSW